VPLLAWSLKGSLAARFLFGVLAFSLLLLYVPPVATLVGTYVGPGQLWRLSWPFSLAVLLTIGWIGWRLAGYATDRLRIPGGGQRLASLLTLLIAVTLVVGAAPSAVAAVKEGYRDGRAGQSQKSCMDPVFRYMRDAIDAPGVVLAREGQGSCVSSWLAPTEIVSIRGQALLKNRATLEKNLSAEVEVPQRALDVQRFFASRRLDEEKLRILRRYGVDYVLLSANDPLNEQLARRPAFTRLDVPRRKYRLYEVDRQTLGGPVQEAP
ncbi:MAG: hypothetical protein M3P49_17770, partial [Actinomycetota bacterium]|nr:hypothetical protein [Actinomycetota bacterium]